MPLVSFIPVSTICVSVAEERRPLDSDASQRSPSPCTVVLPHKKRGPGLGLCDRQGLCPTQGPDVFCVVSFPTTRKIAVEKSSLTSYLKGTTASGVLYAKSRCP